MFGLGEAEEFEGGRGDVGEAAVLFEFGAFEAVVDDDHGDVVGGVGGVGAVVDGVPHLFAVAVVGGDDEGAAFGEDGVDDFADAGVDDFDGLDGGGEFAGVADHVAVGEVDDVDIVIAGGDFLEDDVADLVGGHFGFEVVGFDVGGGLGHAAVFVGEGGFAVVVEEEGDVGEFFGFGGAELREAQLGEVGAEDFGHFFGFVEDDVDGEAGFVGGHGGEVEVFGLGGSLETAVGFGGELGVVVDEGFGDFSGAVAAVVEEEDGVVVGDGAALSDDGGGDEFVAAAGGVGGVGVVVGEGFVGGGVFFAFVFGEKLVGGFDALPAVVAVHGIEAADDGGDAAAPPRPEFFAFGFESGDEAGGAGGGGVAGRR